MDVNTNELEAIAFDPEKLKKLKNVHPGEILKLDFLDEMKISHYALAKGIGVDQTRITAACPDLSEFL